MSHRAHNLIRRHVRDLRKRSQFSNHSERQAQRNISEALHLCALMNAVLGEERIKTATSLATERNNHCQSFVRFVAIAFQQQRNLVCSLHFGTLRMCNLYEIQANSAG